MKRNEARILYSKINAVLNSEAELGFNIVYALTKTKNRMKTEVEEVGEILKKLQDEEKQLVLEYCEKDDYGLPVIRDGKYCGLEDGINTEYDSKIREQMEKRLKYLNEDIDVSIHYINRDDIPQKGKAHILDTLCYFIKDTDGN